jgi:hypothetical protein
MKAAFFCLSLTATIACGEVFVLPHPDEMCPPGKTLVWTAVVQSSFDRLIGDKAPLTFVKAEPESPLIQKMRKFAWNEDKVLPENGWVAMSGPATDQLFATFTKKWRDLAGQEEAAFEKGEVEPSSFAAIAAMKRDFRFAKAFSTPKNASLKWGAEGAAIKFFGTAKDHSSNYGEGVRVLHRAAEGKAKALQLLSAAGDDTMILYTPEQPQTMDAAMEDVLEWRTAWDKKEERALMPDDKRLHSGDDLRIPEVVLSHREDLKDEFAGNLFFEELPVPAEVSRVATMVDLKIDAEGVRFKSSADSAIDPFSGSPHPRRFWFDQPFFLFLWRDGAERPYLGVWFGDTEAFVK